MRCLGRLACIASLTALATSACSSNDKPSSTAASSSTTRPTRASQPPAPAARVILHGDATLDGAPVNSRFVGAVVLDHGLE